MHVCGGTYWAGSAAVLPPLFLVDVVKAYSLPTTFKAILVFSTDDFYNLNCFLAL